MTIPASWHWCHRLSLRGCNQGGIAPGVRPLVSIICTDCMLFKYKDNVYTKHRYLFDCRSARIHEIYEQYLCSLCRLLAARATLPAWGAAGIGAQKLLSFFWLLARIDMDRYANATNLILKMPPALLHCRAMYLCAFFPCVFCNYGRITNGLLSLHTHTLTENQFALHVIVASAVGCLPTYLRLSAQSLISINYGNCC